jgi:rhodanese-related sulfurtransferase
MIQIGEFLILAVVTMCGAVLVSTTFVRRVEDQRALARRSISPEALHEMLRSHRDVLVLDVRQPLDLLGDSVVIPGATWNAPRAPINDSSLLAGRKKVVVYCTCPSDKTSRAVLQRALATGHSNIYLLKGGLDAWRASGYPVEPYNKRFHLDTAESRRLEAAS